MAQCPSDPDEEQGIHVSHKVGPAFRLKMGTLGSGGTPRAAEGSRAFTPWNGFWAPAGCSGPDEEGHLPWVLLPHPRTSEWKAGRSALAQGCTATGVAGGVQPQHCLPRACHCHHARRLPGLILLLREIPAPQLSQTGDWMRGLEGNPEAPLRLWGGLGAALYILSG